MLDATPLTFGKYKGKTPDQVCEGDPSYIVWMYENVDPKPCSKDLYEACMIDMSEQEDGWLDQNDFLANR
jgi:hypothetical protein